MASKPVSAHQLMEGTFSRLLNSNWPTADTEAADVAPTGQSHSPASTYYLSPVCTFKRFSRFFDLLKPDSLILDSCCF